MTAPQSAGRDPLSLPAILDALGHDTDEPDAPYDPVLALQRLGVLLGVPANRCGNGELGVTQNSIKSSLLGVPMSTDED